jgi:hypothetical protein
VVSKQNGTPTFETLTFSVILVLIYRGNEIEGNDEELGCRVISEVMINEREENPG